MSLLDGPENGTASLRDHINVEWAEPEPPFSPELFVPLLSFGGLFFGCNSRISKSLSSLACCCKSNDVLDWRQRDDAKNDAIEDFQRRNKAAMTGIQNTKIPAVISTTLFSRLVKIKGWSI